MINLFEFASKNFKHYNALEFISESKVAEIQFVLNLKRVQIDKTIPF